MEDHSSSLEGGMQQAVSVVENVWRWSVVEFVFPGLWESRKTRFFVGPAGYFHMDLLHCSSVPLAYSFAIQTLRSCFLGGWTSC